MSDKEWLPKPGEKVALVGTFKGFYGMGAFVQIELTDGTRVHFQRHLAEPLPAPAAPRAPWETLREAHDLIPEYEQTTRFVLANTADRLEAAAAPKPPTLAEAVRKWSQSCAFNGVMPEYVREALARAEAGQ